MNKLLKNGLNILKRLNDAGYEAFFVGGYVRDALLGIASEDIDITTNALPETIESLFEKTIPTGKRYGTITVLINRFSYEVTTYRTDHDYLNHRQPSQVIFSSSLIEDLQRRDFTINALTMDKDGKIFDYFNGRDDILKGQVKAIEQPNQRFKEDALRILRAIRFAGKLNFDIESATLNAMICDAHLLKKLPKERVTKELELILNQPHFLTVFQYIETIKLEDVFPDLMHGLKLLYRHPMKLDLITLFVLSMYPNHHSHIEDWKLSNRQIKRIKNILSIMDMLVEQTPLEIIVYHFEYQDVLVANALLAHYDHQPLMDKDIIEANQQLPIKKYQDLNLDGRDLNHLSVDKKQIGKMINQLVKEVLLRTIENDQEKLLERAKQIAGELNDET